MWCSRCYFEFDDHKTRIKVQGHVQDLLQLSARNLFKLRDVYQNGSFSDNGSVSELSTEESWSIVGTESGSDIELALAHTNSSHDFGFD